MYVSISMSILILAPECTYEAIDVQDLRRTLVFVVPHPPLTLLPLLRDFIVVWSTVRFLFIGISLVALGGSVEQQVT